MQLARGPPHTFHPLEEGGQLLLRLLPLASALPSVAAADEAGPAVQEAWNVLFEVRS